MKKYFDKIKRKIEIRKHLFIKKSKLIFKCIIDFLNNTHKWKQFIFFVKKKVNNFKNRYKSSKNHFSFILNFILGSRISILLLIGLILFKTWIFYINIGLNDIDLRQTLFISIQFILIAICPLFYLKKDKNARVACETVAGKGEVLVTGEITSVANDIDIEQIVRQAIKEIGYDNEKTDIDYRTCKVNINISKQSPDIAMGVDKSLEEKEGLDVVSEGAGDQGIMFGFACDETDNFMPMPIYLAHKLAKRLTKKKKKGIIDYLRPDGKTQVTVEYEKDKPIRVDTIVVSTQHNADVDMQVLRKDIKEKVINEVIPKELLDENTKYYINPTGRFVIRRTIE